MNNEEMEYYSGHPEEYWEDRGYRAMRDGEDRLAREERGSPCEVPFSERREG
jgi:hypothetical protein